MPAVSSGEPITPVRIDVSVTGLESTLRKRIALPANGAVRVPLPPGLYAVSAQTLPLLGDAQSGGDKASAQSPPATSLPQVVLVPQGQLITVEVSIQPPSSPGGLDNLG